MEIKNAIIKENKKYFALLGILFFSLILEISMIILFLQKHELVVDEPKHKILLMCLIFIGTSWSLYSLIKNRRKIVVKIVAHNNEIVTTSIGSFPIVRKYSVADLNIEKLSLKSNTNPSLVKISNSKGKILFYTSKDFLDIKKLINTKSIFLNELSEI
ncbi:hypothetical protein FHR24_003087 [Wenyingzhuangia heitensis]|uniref:PH domain-containing protein n=1 Tax=Wenyingzhuangia heitensis TaxID=1487859 RepID=A0ABX0UCN5_9FLAO|nr:hypothetical protein [Wenyingzhuangia heitensis]NIJ46597.1 hypothetical protein [Wenyingzhuangia heitensis]